ncbi:MAG: UDP-N-acetylmuramoyl-L-alanyl-D-glutamate--2,6-diaminopimelate ligase [Solirubrobacterales bacterium]
MELREVLEGAHAEIAGDPATEIAGLALDNRKVAPGALFFCVPGATADGHDFAPAALDAGASAIVVERRLGLKGAEALVPDARAAMAPAAVRFFGDPTQELRVAGITGTNGKTTTAFLLRHILERTGTQTGLLGTVKSVIGGVEADVERTTPEAIDLQATFRAMLEARDSACAMEVSSHALTQGRAQGITFSVGVFTNLTQDHLDFHAGMEDYFAAKRLLFVGPERPPIAVVNIDDPYGARLAEEIEGDYSEGLVTFSGSGAPAALRAMDVEFDATGSRFRVKGPWGEAQVAMPLPGDFNVSNALAALGAAAALGADPQEAARALSDADRVPGRLEPIDAGQPFAVLVDYAHTPDSLDNVLRAARRLTPGPGRLIVVFGCGGDRDRDKRPIMGAIAARLADVGVVTSDNPRSEEPISIVDQIRAGMERDDVVVEVDRHAAIRLAFGLAGAGDTVVIAGKGHEQGQEFEGGRKIPFDDREVARAELAQMGKSR